MLHILKGRVFAEIIWNSSAREICLLLIFIHSFFSLWSHKYLIYILDHNPMLHYLFYCLNFSSFGHWALFQLATGYLLHAPYHCKFFEPFFTF